MRTVRSLCLLLLAVPLLLLPAARGAVDRPATVLERTGQAFSAIAKQAIPAVVFIRVEKTVETGGENYYNNPFEYFGEDFLRRFFYGQPGVEPRRRFKQRGQGSGFLISEDGYILTNNHVVGDADRISVRLHDGRDVEAKRIGTDPKSEVAVIKIDGENLPCVPLGSSDALEIGEWVIAVGNPFGLAETVTAGIVSAKGRSNIGIADYENFIQTDAAINPGNSGGPLLNIKGEVVGINTAIFSQSGGYMGIGFAIPIDMVKLIKDQLVESGKVVRGYLGIYIQEVTGDLAESFGLTDAGGILVADVAPGSAAEESGLQQGDVILEMDGEKVGKTGAFRNAIAANPPGTEISLKIVRAGKVSEFVAVTGTLPDEADAAEEPVDTPAELGMVVQDLTAEIARRLGYEGDEGVIVGMVDPSGPAATVGIERGDLVLSVNREPVGSVAEFNRALRSSEATKTVLLLVKSGGYARYVVLRLD